MRNDKGLSTWEIIVICAICVIIAAILLPIAHSGRDVRASHCQPNLNQLGKAIKIYMSDYDEKFPINRLLNGKVSSHVRLTPDNNNDEVFRYGVNWVEALYPYVEKVGNPGDNETVWNCPQRKSEAVRDDARVTYALNINLVGQPEKVIRDAGHTMMLREMDRRFDAVCRPVNVSKDEETRPISAFLGEFDAQLSKHIRIKSTIHGPGSNILYTDGHVKNMPTTQMPIDNKLYWDKETKQWWNSGAEDKKLIAITP